MSQNLALTMTVGASMAGNFRTVMQTATKSARRVGDAMTANRSSLKTIDNIGASQKRILELQDKKVSEARKELAVNKEIQEVEQRIAALKGKRGQSNLRKRHKDNLASLLKQKQNHQKINGELSKEEVKLSSLTA